VIGLLVLFKGKNPDYFEAPYNQTTHPALQHLKLTFFDADELIEGRGMVCLGLNLR
jgi:hypothetical protein